MTTVHSVTDPNVNTKAKDLRLKAKTKDLFTKAKDMPYFRQGASRQRT